MLYGHFWAKWAERPPKVMNRDQCWNTLQIFPHRDSNWSDSDLWSNALPTRSRRRPTSSVWNNWSANVCVFKNTITIYPIADNLLHLMKLTFTIRVSHLVVCLSSYSQLIHNDNNQLSVCYTVTNIEFHSHQPSSSHPSIYLMASPC